MATSHTPSSSVISRPRNARRIAWSVRGAPCPRLSAIPAATMKPVKLSVSAAAPNLSQIVPPHWSPTTSASVPRIKNP
jgi:hypothetical protein